MSIVHCSYWKLVAAHPWQVQDWGGIVHVSSCTCLILHVRFLFVPVWRLHKQGLMNWNRSLNHIWWKLDTCWYSWILLSGGLRMLTIQSPEKQIRVRCSFLSTFDCEWTKATSVCQESMVHLWKFCFELSEACIQDLWTVPDECSIRSDAAPIKIVSYFLQWWPFSLARFALSNSCPWPSFFQALQRVSSKKRWRAVPEGGLSDCRLVVLLVSSLLVASYITNIPFTTTVSESRIFSELGYVSMFSKCFRFGFMDVSAFSMDLPCVLPYFWGLVYYATLWTAWTFGMQRLHRQLTRPRPDEIVSERFIWFDQSGSGREC